MERYNFTNPLFLLKINSNMRCLYILFCFVFLTACDDGDILTVELEFDSSLEICDNIISEYVVFNTRTDPNESLSLVFPRIQDNILIFNPVVTPYIRTLPIDNSSVFFNYRTYNQEPVFCNSIPNSDIVIIDDYQGTGGSVTITTTYEDSDDDGIPNEDEGADPNNDGDFTDSRDTDGDGLYDYIDQDDDNDNILTCNEDDNEDGDNNPFTNFKDTDNDGVADYLEEDDDGDGTITRLEDADNNGDPRNDYLTDTPGELARYLREDVNQPFEDFGLKSNSYTRKFVTKFIITNLGLEIINTTPFDFGSYLRTSEPVIFDPNAED
jgi:hypothetical protein